MAMRTMDPRLVLCLVPVLIGLGAGVQLVRRWLQAQRPKTYERLAAELGFALIPRKPDDPLPELGAATLHIAGEYEGFGVRIVENATDYIEEGQPLETQTTLILSREGWTLPRFTVEPLTGAVDLRRRIERNRGIFFKKDERFGQRWYVDGPDPDAIRACLFPAATTLLRDSKPIYLDSREDCLLVFLTEKLLSVKQTRRLLDRAIALANALSPLA